MLFSFSGIGASLKSLLKDSDATVRHKATEVLSIIAGIVYESQMYHSTKNIQCTLHVPRKHIVHCMKLLIKSGDIIFFTPFLWMV